jgi:hypothetical protein
MKLSRTRSLLAAAAALLLLASPAFATKYAGEFMKIPVGARAVGMGGAFSAVSDDATSPYWNPAGMVFLPYREAFLQHAEQFGSLVNHDFGSYVMPLRAQGHRRAALGVTATWVGVSDIPITPRPGGLRADQWLDNGADNDPLTNDAGQSNGRWDPGEQLLLSSKDLYMASSSDLALGISYARQRGEHLCYAGTLKFVRQSIPDTLFAQHVTSFGAGLDAGALYMATDAVTLSLVVHDLTTTYLSWSDGVREFVAPTVTTGGAFNFSPAERHALTLATDLVWSFENRVYDGQVRMGTVNADVHAGLEYWYRSTLALRTGIASKDLDFGLGVRYRHFGADYAASLNRYFAASDPKFPDDRSLDATHLVSLSMSW